jgi:hypothetical protein
MLHICIINQGGHPVAGKASLLQTALPFTAAPTVYDISGGRLGGWKQESGGKD